MNRPSMRIPGPDHPITIEVTRGRVLVHVAGKILADTRKALTLRESTYPPIQYIPRDDIDMSLFERSEHRTYCPYKGDCSYFNIPIGGERSVNAAWTYEQAYPSVAAIESHLAFYPNRVERIEVRVDQDG